MTHILLVHGLWLDPWCFEPVRRQLDRAGVASTAIRLPLTSLADDVATTRDALDRLSPPVLLVGHSYGGAVITEAGVHPSVAHLAYLAAFALAEGESISQTLPDAHLPETELPAALRFDDLARTVSIDPDLARGLMFTDVPVPLADEALSRLRPVSRALFRGVPEAIAWRVKASTYAVCTEDLVVHPDLQRAMADRTAESVRWPCGHLPILSRPDVVAALLVRLAAGLT